MGVQIRKGRVVAVAVKRLFRLPLDEDQDRSRLDASGCGCSELAQSDHAPAVRLDFLRRPSRIRKVLLLVRDVEQI
jgi:hypothetical protein